MAILRDPALTKEQIRERLRTSFTDEQQQLVLQQQTRLRLMRQEFQNTLTEGQRNMLQERIQQRVRNSGEQGELRNGNRSNSNGQRNQNTGKGKGKGN